PKGVGSHRMRALRRAKWGARRVWQGALRGTALAQRRPGCEEPAQPRSQRGRIRGDPVARRRHRHPGRPAWLEQAQDLRAANAATQSGASPGIPGTYVGVFTRNMDSALALWSAYLL